MSARLLASTLLAVLPLATPLAAAVDVGDAAPVFQLADFEGTPKSLADLRGQVVVLNFWATWCAPCRAELPVLDELGVAQADAGVVYLAVNIDESDKKAKVVWNRLGMRMPTVWDPGQTTVAAYAPDAMPTTYVLDRQGEVRWVEAGAVTPETAAAFAERVRTIAAVSAADGGGAVVEPVPDEAARVE